MYLMNTNYRNNLSVVLIEDAIAPELLNLNNNGIKKHYNGLFRHLLEIITGKK